MEHEFIFPNWWSALADVPSGSSELDWWAAPDGRHSKCERLFRVWSDPTDSVPPPFYRLKKEKHLAPALWENFSLFDPVSIVHGLCDSAGIIQPPPATDICWSWEYNLGHGDRQLDIAVHVRSGDQDMVIVGEAKARKLRFDRKDLQPRDILHRAQFKFADTRRYFLLGDAAPSPDWPERGHGHLNWPCFADLQIALCESIPEDKRARELLQCLIAKQFEAHGIQSKMAEMLPTFVVLAEALRSSSTAFKSDRFSRFARCALHHLRCVAGLETDQPIDYLRNEPNVDAIRPRWLSGCGGRTVNEVAYWKIPTMSESQVDLLLPSGAKF